MSDAQGELGTPSSAGTITGYQTELQMRLPSTPTEAQQQFHELIPSDYHATPWYAQLSAQPDPFSEMAKLLTEQASQRAGRRGAPTAPAAPAAVKYGVPGPEASEADRKAFLTALGVPNSIEGYEYTFPELSEADKPLEGLLKEARSEEALRHMREAALKAGIPVAAWKELTKAYDELFFKQLKADVERETAALNKRLEEMQASFTQQFGPRVEEVKAQMSNLLALQPDYVQQMLGDLSPTQALGLAALLDDLAKTYIREDSFLAPNNVKPSLPNTADEYGQMLKDLFVQQAKYPVFSSEYRDLEKRIGQLRQHFDQVIAKKSG